MYYEDEEEEDDEKIIIIKDLTSIRNSLKLKIMYD